MKRKYNLSYTKYSSSTIAIFICYVVVNGLIGVSVLAYWSLFHGEKIPSILFLAFSIMVACIMIFWFPFDRFQIPEKIRQWSHQAMEGWKAISQNPGLLVRVAILQAVLVFMLSLRYWIAFGMLSQNVSLGQTLLFSSATILTQLISIAPGGFGVREAIVASVATALGFETGISIIAVGLDRLVATMVIVLTGWIATVILGRQISTAPSKLESP